MHHGVVNQAIFRVCVCVWDKKKNYIWNDSLRDNTMRLMSKKDVQLKNRQAESLSRCAENAKHAEESVYEV